MAKLYDTIKNWADGQNVLNTSDASRQATLQLAAKALLTSLRQYCSLADLAVAYHAEDIWWRRMGEEFALSAKEAAAVRNAAHWQRFMEIRHPRTAERR
jgi:hypothetical protein